MTFPPTDPISNAYWERNQLVAALTHMWPSYLGIDLSEDNPDWQIVVYVESPEGQLSWHIHQDEIREYFSHLNEIHPQRSWDGHDTAEKYRRLRESFRK